MITITIKEQEYIASLDVNATCNAEDRIGKNLLTLFLGIDRDELPKLKDLLIIFQESLVRYQHGMTFDKAKELYDSYIKDGHKFGDFVLLVTDIMKDGGLVDEEEEEESKN